MPRVEFEDGISIDFDQDPTPEDIDEAYESAKFGQGKPGNIPKSENILSRALKAGTSAFTPRRPDISHPFQSSIESTMGGLKRTPGIGPYMQAHDVKSDITQELIGDSGIPGTILDIATDPETFMGTGIAGKFLGKQSVKLGQKAKSVYQAPQRAKQVGSEIADIEGQLARSEAEASAPNMARRGESIIQKAHKGVVGGVEGELEELGTQSRNVFAKHAPVAKERFGKLAKGTYSKYGEILKGAEDEAMQAGMNADEYREAVINPVLETIERTGAKTPVAEKLKRMFTVSEGLGDTAMQKADEATLRNFENLSSIEKMKALRSSFYKEGSDDFIQTMYSDLHSNFVSKYSPSLAEANKSYGPIKQALRWGSKNIKPFNQHEIKKVADIIQKSSSGGLDETTSAYLNTLKTGRGPFKGSDITKLGAKHQEVLSAIESRIKQSQDILSKLESQNLSDIATVRQGGMQATLDKQNILQRSAGQKSKLAQLKELQSQIKRDVRTRDDLIKFGIIAGLGGFVGKGIYALASALHER